MSIRIDAPDTSSGSTTSEPSPDSSTSSATAQNDGKLVNGMRKDFKEAMDSYEAFMNEYVAFMKKIQRESERPHADGGLRTLHEQVCGCVREIQ